MTILRKKSSLITLVTLCLLALIVSGGFFTIYLTADISTDAETINKLGVIRGATQRLVKLELYNVENEELKRDIENRINKFTKEETQLYDKDGEIRNAIEELNVIWRILNNHINKYRLNPSLENKEELIIASEETWEELDNIVLMSQLSSEAKMNRYRISSIILGVNTFLAVMIIFLTRKYVRDTLEHLVDHDVLTNIYNRRYFDEKLGKDIAKAEKQKRDLSMIMLDIDHFKKVNDTYGHDAGDVVLKDMSELVGENIRKNDTFARVGGEEFAIIAIDTDLEGMFILAEEIRQIIENHEFNYDAKNITVSIGVAQYQAGDNSMLLFKRADNALYKAKHNGRNRVC